MKKLHTIEQKLLTLSPAETRRLLAWIDHRLQEDYQPLQAKNTVHPAILQRGHQVADNKNRARQS